MGPATIMEPAVKLLGRRLATLLRIYGPNEQRHARQRETQQKH